jgi:hypothetical protein
VLEGDDAIDLTPPADRPQWPSEAQQDFGDITESGYIAATLGGRSASEIFSLTDFTTVCPG